MPRPPLIESESRRKLAIAVLMGALLALSLGLAWPTTRGVGQRSGQWLWQEVGPAAVPVPGSWDRSDFERDSLSQLGLVRAVKWSDPRRESRWLVMGLIERDTAVSEAGSLLLELMSSLTEGEVSPGAAHRDAVRRIQTPRVTGATLTRAVRLGSDRQAEHQVTILTGRGGSRRTLLMLYLHDVYRPEEGKIAQQNRGLMTQLALNAQWDAPD